MCKCHVLIKKQKNKIIEYIFSKTVKKLQDIQSAKSQKNSDSWSVSAKKCFPLKESKRAPPLT